MYFLFSGEGECDLGECAGGAAACEGDGYLHGPMAIIVDQMVEVRCKYSILKKGCCGFVSRAMIKDGASALKAAKKGMLLPGKKREKETHYFYKNARVLARIAQQREAEKKDVVVAILFRDADTANAGRGCWSEKRQSILDGFTEEGFPRGVPMIPKPSSEVWLLCALRENPCQGCAALEDRSGSPKAKNPLKDELEKRLGRKATRDELCILVKNCDIDHRKIDMPSFSAFRNRLEEVLGSVKGNADL